MRRVVLIAVLVICSLTGCKAEQEKTEPVDSAVIYTRGQGFSKEGITFLEKGIVQYTDFSTGETMPLCSRLNCSHRILTGGETENGGEPCMAYVRDAYQAILYREKLYVFTVESSGICIYISDADGANRKLLAELSGAVFSGGFTTEFYGNRLALMTLHNKISTQEGEEIDVETYYRLYCIDCETGQVTACSKEWNSNATIKCVDDTSVYVYHTYTDDAVYEKYTSEELYNNPLLSSDYKKGELWLCSPEDGSANELYPGKFGEDRSLIGVNKAGAVIGISEEAGTGKTVYLSFVTGEEIEMLSSFGRVLFMNEDYALLSATEGKEGEKIEAIYRFFYEKGSLEKVDMDTSLTPSRMLGGNLYCMKDDGQTRVMSLDEFLSGGSEELYLMDRIIYEINK